MEKKEKKNKSQVYKNTQQQKQTKHPDILT